jgi:LacI family transcriptional regulator
VITSERAGYITLGYSELLRDVIKSYYKNGGDKQMYFVRVYDGGQLLKKCESVFNSTLTELGKKHYLLDSDDSYTRTYGDFINIFKKQKNGYFIAYRDSIAAAILNAATDSGLKVPDDIEILSLVGTKYANIVRPTLTSMQISMSEVGKRAMYMLIDLINGSQGPKSYLFSPVLTPKSSTKFN